LDQTKIIGHENYVCVYFGKSINLRMFHMTCRLYVRSVLIVHLDDNQTNSRGKDTSGFVRLFYILSKNKKILLFLKIYSLFLANNDVFYRFLVNFPFKICFSSKSRISAQNRTSPSVFLLGALQRVLSLLKLKTARPQRSGGVTLLATKNVSIEEVNVNSPSLCLKLHT